MNKLLAKITLWWNGYCLKCFEAKDSFLSSECWVCKRDRKNRERERERDRYEEPRGVGFTLAEFAIEWQRQMYLAPEPEVPEEISDLLYRHPKGFSDNFIGMDQADENTREAYRRGKESK